MTDEDPLRLLEEHIGGLLSGLNPRERVKVARKAGQEMRKANTSRIRKQVQPDGSKFAARSIANKRKHRGPMFKKLRYARYMTISPSSDGFELSFRPSVQRVARIHHYGLRQRMTLRDKVYEVQLPERQLIGHNAADRERMLDIIVELLDEM